MPPCLTHHNKFSQPGALQCAHHWWPLNHQPTPAVAQCSTCAYFSKVGYRSHQTIMFPNEIHHFSPIKPPCITIFHIKSPWFPHNPSIFQGIPGPVPFRWRCPGCRASSRPGAGACPARCGDRPPPRCHGPGKGRRIPRCSAGNRRPGWKMIYIYILIVSWDYYSHILWKNIKCSKPPTRYSHISSDNMSIELSIVGIYIYIIIYIYMSIYLYILISLSGW